MANYRKIYKDHYRMEYAKGFDIHHIDEDRNNNNIHNLILLPRRVHHIYHYGMEIIKSLEPQSLFDPCTRPCAGIDKIIKPIENALKAIDPWVDFKEYMDRMMYFKQDDWIKIRVEMDENLSPIVYFERLEP